VRPRFAWSESLERPERPTQTCGKHEDSLSELADSNCVDPAGLLLFGLYDSGASRPRHAMCLPSGPETQEIDFYPIPTEYESARSLQQMRSSADDTLQPF
jgi:hypothetical protein